MNTKERILTIRLLEKIVRAPAYAGSIGIEVRQEPFGVDPKINNERGA